MAAGLHHSDGLDKNKDQHRTGRFFSVVEKTSPREMRRPSVD